MNWHRRLAALFALLALTGCAPVAVGPGQTPNAPYQQYALTGGPTTSPSSKPGPAVPLLLGPPRVSPAERVQFFPASKPATGTALDISLPSIRNTRPCDAERRIFNAS
jgi:hypothetical protein